MPGPPFDGRESQAQGSARVRGGRKTRLGLTGWPPDRLNVWRTIRGPVAASAHGVEKRKAELKAALEKTGKSNRAEAAD